MHTAHSPKHDGVFQVDSLIEAFYHLDESVKGEFLGMQMNKVGVTRTTRPFSRLRAAAGLLLVGIPPRGVNSMYQKVLERQCFRCELVLDQKFLFSRLSRKDPTTKVL